MKQFVLFTALVFTALPADAKACVLLPFPEQSRAEKRHWSREQTKVLTLEASKRLALGGVNVANELADILVPNIRPVALEYSDCGPEGEIDFAGGVDETYDGLSDDPRLKGVDLSDYRGVFRNFDGETILGPSCNAEFRTHFATWLRSNLNDEELRAAWLYLTPRTRQSGNYGSVYHRLISFDQSTRRPPMRWSSYDEWIAKDITHFNRSNVVGRRLGEIISTFWAQREPLLASHDAVCPKAQATWHNDRERLIKAVLGERNARMQLRKQRQVRPSG